MFSVGSALIGYFFFRSASPNVKNLPLGKEKANNLGEYFFRIERRTGDDPDTKCRKWFTWQDANLKNAISNADKALVACPCTEAQAFFDTRFPFLSFQSDSICYYSVEYDFELVVDNSSVDGYIERKCCYSTFQEDFGALIVEGIDKGSLEVTYTNKPNNTLDDADAKQICCYDSFNCFLYFEARPSDRCLRYRVPLRRK